MLAIGGVVVAQNLQQTVFLEQLTVTSVVDIRIKQRRDLNVRVLRLEDAVVLHCFRDAGGRQDGMEHTAPTQLCPVLVNVAGNRLAVVVLTVLSDRQVVFDTLGDTLGTTVGVCLIDAGHRDLVLVHKLVVDSRLLGVRQSLVHGRGLGLLESNHSAHIMRPEGFHHLRVEAEDVTVANTVGN